MKYYKGIRFAGPQRLPATSTETSKIIGETDKQAIIGYKLANEIRAI